MDVGVAKQPSQQLQGRMLVAALLNEDVQNFALIVDRSPQIHPPPADLHDRLIQMPAARRPITASAQIGGDTSAPPGK